MRIERFGGDLDWVRNVLAADQALADRPELWLDVLANPPGDVPCG
jgi:hypothetical protein